MRHRWRSKNLCSYPSRQSLSRSRPRRSPQEHSMSLTISLFRSWEASERWYGMYPAARYRPGSVSNASTGDISGIPSQPGSFNFTLRVTDQIPQFDEQNFTITITSPAPPLITGPSSLRAGTVNQPYPDTQLTATGGVQPYSWSVNPALPNGLTLNPSSGVITGTPLSGSHGNSLA